MTSILELDIDVDTNGTNGILTIPTEVPVQELTLKGYRVQYDSAAEALSAKEIHVAFPWIGHTQVNGNHNIRGFPLLLDNAIVTNRQTEYDVTVHKVIPERFEYQILGTTTGLDHIHLIFNYSIGSIH